MSWELCVERLLSLYESLTAENHYLFMITRPSTRQQLFPIKLRGLGIRHSDNICLPGYIASSLTCTQTVSQLLSKSDTIYFNFLSEAVMTGKIWTFL